jgi:hypothetical protein
VAIGFTAQKLQDMYEDMTMSLETMDPNNVSRLGIQDFSLTLYIAKHHGHP